MLGSFAATVRSTCLRWPAVLLGCVLSVLAPFGESTVVQLIAGSSALSQGGPTLSECDSIEDEEDLYRPRVEDDSWRVERKHALPLLCCGTDQADAFLTHLQARRATAHHHGPGCEHAYRNGSGGPLLC